MEEDLVCLHVFQHSSFVSHPPDSGITIDVHTPIAIVHDRVSPPGGVH
jgi:hypothetical protein